MALENSLLSNTCCILSGVTSISRSYGSNTMATSSEYVSNPSVVAADQARPANKKQLLKIHTVVDYVQ